MGNRMYSLFEFTDKRETSLFEAIDDRIMGGVSKSAMLHSKDSTAVFIGKVSLENNGGFASVRSYLDSLDLSECDGISLRIQGDGKRYKLRMFSGEMLDSVAYESTFVSPEGIWKTIEIPFLSLEPKWRGRVVENAPAFDKKNVSGLGLMISEQQAGEFALQIDWIRVY